MLTRLVHLAARVRAMFRPAPLDRDLDAEFVAHIAMLTDENIRRGMTPADAERAARLAVGGLSQLRDAHRETRSLPALETLMRDLRYAFRTLRRDAGFTTFAILIVGLGIGASATVFSVLNTLILRPLPYAHHDRLVWMWNLSDDGHTEWSWQVGHFVDLREQTRSFEDLAGYFVFNTADDMTLSGASSQGNGSGDSGNGASGSDVSGVSGSTGSATRLTSVRVTQNFFAFLGVQPALGRTFTAEESLWNGPRAVMLSDPLWRSRFASDPHIVGRTMTLNELPYTIVGVLPASFDFSTVLAPGVRRDIYLPMPLSMETSRWGNSLGASAGALQASIILQTLKLAALGLLIGVVASWALGRMLSGLLFGVTATDPVTFVSMLTVLTLVAALAGYIPARRASRIDPLTALRAQ